MTTYWVPSDGDGYVEVDADELRWIDVMCKSCRAKRLQRFCAPVSGPGYAGVQPFTGFGKTIGPLFKMRGGALHFHLACGCGYEVPVTLAQVTRLLQHAESFPDRRVFL